MSSSPVDPAGETASMLADPVIPGLVIDGRYHLRHPIGEGGFARVYEALDVKLERTVAVKLLKHHEDPNRRAAAEKRFFREAKFAAKLDHPDIVTIYDFGVAEGSPYIVLELLKGQSLDKELWLNGPVEPEVARRLFTRVLHAMATAHDAGVIHRDLKPANLLLTHRGELIESLRILDFGIAFYFGEALTRLTASGQFLGTPEYIAPEYVREQKVTPALDVYQLGLIFIEMLIGRPLVSLEHPLQCMFAHCNGHVLVPQYLRGSKVGDILARAIATELHERYPNARAFFDDFATLGPGDIPAPPAEEIPAHHAITNQWSSDVVERWSRSVPGLLDEREFAVSTLEVSSGSPDERWPPQSEGRMGRSRVLLPVMAIIAVVGTVVAIQAFQQPEEPEALTDPVDTEVLPVVVSNVAPDPTENDPVERAVPGDAEIASPARLIRLETTPPGAEILEAGVLLGLSPLEIALKSGGVRDITARLPGYQERTFTVGESTASELRLSLARKRTAKPPVKAPADETLETPPLRSFD